MISQYFTRGGFRPGCSTDAKVMHIAKRHRVSENTVRAIREREAVAIADRKQRLISIFGNVAETAGERMEELAGKAGLRDAGTTAGIATDKVLALTGQTPAAIQFANIVPEYVTTVGLANDSRSRGSTNSRTASFLLTD
jgi:hypothetical protein